MKTSRYALSLAIANCLASSAFAVSLTDPVGAFEDFALPGTTLAARPELGGSVLDEMLHKFTFDGAGASLTLKVLSQVVRSDLDGTLDFYWRLTKVEGNGGIEAFRVDGFDGMTLDADWRMDDVGERAPGVARYFGSTDGSVNFLFDDLPAGAGLTSYFFFLDTQARAYDKSGRFDVLCGPSECISDLFATFAPVVVPLPAAAWLFGSGLLGLIGAAWRKTGPTDNINA